MKRAILLFAAVMLLILLCSCASYEPADPPAGEVDVSANSILRLCEDMQIDERHAASLVELFSYMNLTGEVLFAYPSEDENGMAYYHVWIGDKTADVYLRQDGTASAILVGGALLYGSVPLPTTPDRPNDSNPNEGSGDEDGLQQPPSPSDPADPETSIQVLSHTAKVAPGDAGYVRALGEPGVEYKIKVYYASGVSTAKALSPQVAGEDGTLVWEWTVNSRVKPGVYKIVIVRSDDEEDAITLPFEVIEAQE